MASKSDPGPCDPTQARALHISRTLQAHHAGARTSLVHRNPFELLIATILSAQCTDAKVNQVTPALFARFPDPAALAAADRSELETMIHSTGFFRDKAKNIQNCCQALTERFGGTVPESMDDLTSLPGVGRKTANVVRGQAMGLPGAVVDTHVKRIMGLLALTHQSNPDKIEADIMRLLPESHWTPFTSALILHGRTICVARKPRCTECPIRTDCPHGMAQG